MVIAELLGFPVADWRGSRVERDDHRRSATQSGTGAAEAAAAFRAADAEMTDYFGRLVRERRARPTSDLLGRLVAAEVDGERLDDGELVRFFQLLLAAGTETTTNLIDNAVIALLEHSDQLAQLRADASRIPAALEEVLRHRTPVQAMFRATRREVTLDGVDAARRAFVIAAIGCANRDPDAFGDAERFDIAREPNPHLAFGHGIHFCLGAPLSRLEGSHRAYRSARALRVARARRAGVAAAVVVPRARPRVAAAALHACASALTNSTTAASS